MTPSPSISRTLKPIFRRIRLIRCTYELLSPCLDAYISKYGDFCANDNNDTTDYFTPCACARGNNAVPRGSRRARTYVRTCTKQVITREHAQGIKQFVCQHKNPQTSLCFESVGKAHEHRKRCVCSSIGVGR